MSEQFDSQDAPVAFAPMTPSRDLWPDIAAEIRPRRRRLRLVPAALAASMALATSLTLLTSPQFAQRGATDMQQVADLMQVQQRADLGALASAVQGPGVDKAMDGLLAAEQQIRAAIDSGSSNPALLEMLATVHRHQLEMIDKSMKA